MNDICNGANNIENGFKIKWHKSSPTPTMKNSHKDDDEL